jgi:large subunit ribosomal protein L20
MAKVGHSVATRRRKKRILKDAKGYWGDSSKQFQHARRALKKALVYTYRDRKVRKREFRQLWIARINAAARINGTTYSRLINALNVKGVGINRKVLASLALENPAAFTEFVTFSAN